MIAKRAGLGLSTVSHALRHDGTVSAATRERVQALARELGYVPSPVLASLASRKFHSEKRLRHTPLAYLVFPGTKNLDHPSFPIHKSGLVEECQRLGYRCLTSILKKPEAARQEGNRLYASGVAGLALGLSFAPRSYPWEELGLDRFAVVACGIHPLSGRVHTVKAATFGPVQRAWQEARRRGYQRIGAALCRHAQDIEDDHLRVAAILECHHSAGLPQKVPFFLGAHDDITGFLSWVKRHQPDVVIGFHGGMLYWMRDAGIRVPEQIGFINLHMEQWHQGICAGVDVRSPEIGRRAARMLDELIRHRERGLTDTPQTLLVDYIWRDGPTLRDATPTPRRRSR